MAKLDDDTKSMLERLKEYRGEKKEARSEIEEPETKLSFWGRIATLFWSDARGRDAEELGFILFACVSMILMGVLSFIAGVMLATRGVVRF